MSKVQDLLREYTAPLEDNYGKTTYDAVIASLELKLPAAIAEDAGSFVWRVSWMRQGKKQSTLFGSNNTEEQMVKSCEQIAASFWKRPVTLEAIVERKVWE